MNTALFRLTFLTQLVKPGHWLLVVFIRVVFVFFILRITNRFNPSLEVPHYVLVLQPTYESYFVFDSFILLLIVSEKLYLLDCVGILIELVLCLEHPPSSPLSNLFKLFKVTLVSWKVSYILVLRNLIYRCSPQPVICIPLLLEIFIKLSGNIVWELLELELLPQLHVSLRVLLQFLFLNF